MRKTRKRSIFNIVVISTISAVLFLYALTIVSVLLWGLLTSLKSNVDFFIESNQVWLPNLDYSRDEVLKLANYKLIFDNFSFDKSIKFYVGNTPVEHNTSNNMFTMILNTFLYAGVGSLLQSLVPAAVAYACAKFPFKYGKLMYNVALFAMIVPLVGTYPSEISLFRSIGLYDTFFGYFLQKFSFGGMYFFVYFAFYQSMPNTYSEAAEIDGASRWKILTSIIIPLSLKMISTVWLIQFVHFWNDYNTALLYMPTKPTIAYGVYYLCHETARGRLANVPAKVAACMMLAVPIFILFVFLKDKLMGNLSSGGTKE